MPEAAPWELLRAELAYQLQDGVDVLGRDKVHGELRIGLVVEHLVQGACTESGVRYHPSSRSRARTCWDEYGVADTPA